MFRIGFLGLGMMGLPMARRLAEHGHQLTLLDPATHRVEALLAGCPLTRAASGISDIAAECGIVITCLPDAAAVEATYLTGASPLASLARPGTITIDHSTTSPELARRIHHAAADHGVLHLEAPLFGGVREAAEGQLFLALSGSDAVRPSQELLPAIREIAQTVARGWQWVGGPGTAATVKVLQNGLGLVQLAAMGEVAAACRTLNLDPQMFYALVNDAGGMAATPLFRERFPRMMAPQAAEARLAIGAKDAKLYRDLIQAISSFSPAAASAAAYGRAIAIGLEDADVTTVWEVFTQTSA